jgi:2-polyprenyl-3-methyl-5-hydroxy-6-metoxy-1,4-benzoquinol methylase
MTNAGKTTCRLCGSQELFLLIDLGSQPIAHRLLEQPQDEFTHPLKVHFCESCGLGQITDPIDPEILYKGYNYCFSSWKPEPHRETELNLISTHNQKGKVFEIGCNDGLFLEQLSSRGQKVCVGLEPNSFAAKIARETRGLPVYETFLDEGTCQEALKKYGKFDLVVARQVLEHVSGIDLFFKCVDRLLAENGMIFIDVPNVGPGLRVGDCTIVWEEHVNYFTENVLRHTLDRFGFTPIASDEFNYSGGTLAVLARRKMAADRFVPTREFHSYAKTFSQRVEDYRSKLVLTLEKARQSLDQIVIYGVGCRACTLINGLDLGKIIDFAVDDQVERQGNLMPGSKLSIKSPKVLNGSGSKSLVLLAVNQENETKVKTRALETCQDSQLAFLSVFGPSDIRSELDSLARTLTK